MEPLAALGLASNILQLIDFSTKLVKGSRALYKSAAPSSGDNIILEIIAKDLDKLSDSTILPDDSPEDLKRLARETKTVTRELQEALGKLKVSGQKTKWNSFRIALREIWSHDKIEAVSLRLGRLQAELNTHMQVVIRFANLLWPSIDECGINADSGISKHVREILAGMNDLRGMAGRFDLDQTSRLEELHDKLIQSIEGLIQQKLRDISSNKASIPEVVEKTNFTNRTELSAVISAYNKDLNSIGIEISNARHDWDFLGSLYFENISARHDAVVDAHAKTFSWVFRDVLPDGQPIQYVKWLRELDGIFWVHGKPGSGKSTLMKFLVHHPDTTRHLQAWAKGKKLVIGKHFFWNSGTRLQKSREGLLRSLLFEIIRQLPSHIPAVYKAITYDESGLEGTANDFSTGALPFQPGKIKWTEKALMRAFEYLQEQDLAVNFCFFIDGLDEYADDNRKDHRELITVLRYLTRSLHIKICVSSRSWTVFSDAFGNRPGMSIQLEDLTRDDIRRYVKDSFNEHEQFAPLCRLDPDYSKLAEQVAIKAQGVFLWVFLAVRDLLEGFTYNDTIKTMRIRLDRFPEDLEGYFKHIFDSIPSVYRLQAARTFSIALLGKTPLPWLIYYVADNIDEDPRFFRQGVIPRQSEFIGLLGAMKRRLDGRSRGLLQLGGGELKQTRCDFEFPCVEFLHRTVRDFLLENNDVRAHIGKSMEGQPKTEFVACRAAYRILECTWEPALMGVYRRILSDFIRLATMDAENDPTVYQFLSDIFMEPRNRMSQVLLDGRQDAGELLGLCQATEFGLASFVKKQISERLGSTPQCSPFASEHKRIPVLSLILAHCLFSPVRGHRLSAGLVEYLTSQGASPNFIVSGADSIFARFVGKLQTGGFSPDKCGVLEILKILVASGAELDVVPFSTQKRARETIVNCCSPEEADWVLSNSTPSATPKISVSMKGRPPKNAPVPVKSPVPSQSPVPSVSHGKKRKGKRLWCCFG